MDQGIRQLWLGSKFSPNLSEMVPEGPLNKMVPPTEDRGGGGGGMGIPVSSRTIGHMGFVHWKKLIEIMVWTSNYIHWYVWDVIGHSCPNFNGGLAKSALKLGREWVIIFIILWLIFIDIIHPCPKLIAGLANLC